VLRTNGEKYTSKYHKFAFGSNAATWQLQLNGTLTPGFPATVPEMYAISKNAVDYGDAEVHTLDQYRNNFAVVCHRLSLPNSGTRELSGVDTRGISLQGSVNTTAIPDGQNLVVFGECTSVLQIGQGKQFSVVL
jgi:hypothetical protein